MTEKYRISIHCCFKNGELRQPDIPRMIMENIETPFDCVKSIRSMFGEKCLPDQNLFLSLPKEFNRLTFIMLNGGNKGCRCKLYIEKYKE